MERRKRAGKGGERKIRVRYKAALAERNNGKPELVAPHLVAHEIAFKRIVICIQKQSEFDANVKRERTRLPGDENSTHLAARTISCFVPKQTPMSSSPDDTARNATSCIRLQSKITEGKGAAWPVQYVSAQSVSIFPSTSSFKA
jgi:hypothetical protein